MSFVSRIVILIIKGYKVLLSPWLGNRCRFYPTCSAYMILSIEKYGLLKGLFKGVKRILRCHPFCKGGIDYP